METLTPKHSPRSAEIGAALEDLWQRLDMILGGLGPADWTRRHGADWTVADVPYHLGYFDGEQIAVFLEAGPGAPPAARWRIRSIAEMNAWNTRMFAARPANQTPGASLEQMQASRQRICAILSTLTDADLDRPAWSPFFGWLTTEQVLDACVGHTWNHLLEIQARLGRPVELPAAATTHRALGNYMRAFATMVDPAAASGREFTAVLEFRGPGGGAWTLHVADGTCAVCAGRVGVADLELRQSPITFAATLTGRQRPLPALLTGKVRVRGLRQMGRFGQLFPQPQPDDPIWDRPAGRNSALARDPAPRGMRETRNEGRVGR